MRKNGHGHSNQRPVAGRGGPAGAGDPYEHDASASLQDTPESTAPDGSPPVRRTLGLLTADEVASAFDLDVRTLSNWRSERRGPPWVSVGRTPMYRRGSLLRWLERREKRDLVE
jgi:hypothetical protein